MGVRNGMHIGVTWGTEERTSIQHLPLHEMLIIVDEVITPLLPRSRIDSRVLASVRRVLEPDWPRERFWREFFYRFAC